MKTTLAYLFIYLFFTGGAETREGGGQESHQEGEEAASRNLQGLQFLCRWRGQLSRICLQQSSYFIFKILTVACTINCVVIIIYYSNNFGLYYKIIVILFIILANLALVRSLNYDQKVCCKSKRTSWLFVITTLLEDRGVTIFTVEATG